MTITLNPPTPADTEICPACLTEIPADDPYDHVAIDQALDGNRRLFARMSTAEQSEVVITARARGIGIVDLARRLRWPYGRLEALLPADHPDSTARRQAREEQAVGKMWLAGLDDMTIGACTGIDPRNVGRLRRRLGLDVVSAPVPVSPGAAGAGRPYMKLEMRNFLRYVRLGLVHRTATGLDVMKGGTNRRCETLLRAAVATGWVASDPDRTTGRYQLTDIGHADLTAREAAAGRTL